MVLRSDFYKVGIIVDSLEAAVAAYREVFDYDWRAIPSAPFPVEIDGEIRTVTVRAAVTVQEPRLHLIERIADTPWTSSPDAGAHHLAYWVEDFPTAARELLAAGFVMELGEATAPAARTYGYFSKPNGSMRIEILERPMPDAEWAATIASMPSFGAGASE